MQKQTVKDTSFDEWFTTLKQIASTYGMSWMVQDRDKSSFNNSYHDGRTPAEAFDEVCLHSAADPSKAVTD